MVALRQQEDLHVPSVDYSLTESKLSPQSCYMLVQKARLVVAQGPQEPPPQHATLTLGLYADGYQPCARPYISTKISLIDFERQWFPVAGSVPGCTNMVSCLELPKTVYAERVPNRGEALHALPSCIFRGS